MSQIITRASGKAKSHIIDTRACVRAFTKMYCLISDMVNSTAA